MTTTFKTPQDFYTYYANFYKSVPKTYDEAKDALVKVQAIAKTEFDNTQDVLKTYAKAATGDATPNEITKANKKAVELAKYATFTTMLAVPGAVFALPLIVEKAKEHKLDIVPASVAAQFSI